MFRGLVSVAAAAMLAVALTACSADAAPVPSPTGFASEEEAFAAAEETYRAYVDALNEVDLSDPATFEGVYAWTTGELNASDRKGLSSYHADGVSIEGTSAVLRMEPVRFDHKSHAVSLAVCLDVSAVLLTTPSGESLVDPSRVNVQSLAVSFEGDSASPTGFAVNAIGPRDGEPAC